MCPNGDIVNNALSTSFESLNAILGTYVGHPIYEGGLEKWATPGKRPQECEDPEGGPSW